VVSLAQVLPLLLRSLEVHLICFGRQLSYWLLGGPPAVNFQTLVTTTYQHLITTYRR